MAQWIDGPQAPDKCHCLAFVWTNLGSSVENCLHWWFLHIFWSSHCTCVWVQLGCGNLQAIFVGVENCLLRWFLHFGWSSHLGFDENVKYCPHWFRRCRMLPTPCAPTLLQVFTDYFGRCSKLPRQWFCWCRMLYLLYIYYRARPRVGLNGIIPDLRSAREKSAADVRTQLLKRPYHCCTQKINSRQFYLSIFLFV